MTKTVPVERIVEAVALGVTDFGESRVQEARAKQSILGSRIEAQGNSLEPRTSPPEADPLRHVLDGAENLEPLRWHLVGHLQRNKAKLAVEMFDVIHSVDSLELAQELERHASRSATESAHSTQHTAHRPLLEVLIQVNISGEATKSGCDPEEAGRLAEALGAMAHLRLAGLMTIPPFEANPEAARPHFRRLRELRDSLQSSTGPPGHLSTGPLKLSMGMSHDFEIAIEEGADLIRVGTAIFG